MDYPFYLHKIAQIDNEDVVAFLKTLNKKEDYVTNPLFYSKKNKGVNQIKKEKLDSFIHEKILPKIDSLIPKEKLIWYECNAIAPKCILNEHADFESTAFDHNTCDKPYFSALEVTLCHKIHVHLYGESAIEFRRSRKEKAETIKPEIGGIYLFNNYILHKSKNIGKTDRLALSLVMDDRNWLIKKQILKNLNLLYYQTYDGRDSHE